MRLVKKRIFRKETNRPLIWADIKHLDFLDEDEIGCEWDYGEEVVSFITEVYRMLPETDEERERREAWTENYLKRQKEFEDGWEDENIW